MRSPALSSSPSSPDFLIGQNSRKKNLGGIRNVERGKSGMGTAETGFHHQTRADAGATANANDQKKVPYGFSVIPPLPYRRIPSR